MRINVPDLNYSEAMDFCFSLQGCTLDIGETCEVDFSSVCTCNPFPMLIVSNALSRFRKKYTNNLFVPVGCDNSYAKYMKFYRACGINYGENVEDDRHREGYSTITKICISELEREGHQSNRIIQEVIDDRAKIMSEIVAQRNIPFQKWLSFVLREMIRNIPEHSESDTIWYCAQYWPSYDLVELAILDEGIGIKESLFRGEKVNKNTSDVEAIKLSLEPGISGAGTNIFDEDWQNSGYGLYMVSQMCAELGGSFIVSSGNAAAILGKDNGTVEITENKSYVEGTAIQIRVKPSSTLDYDHIRREILQRGEKRARTLKNGIHSASKASRGFM